MNGALVIGLGSGRCGTSSLAALLDAQPDATVMHERRAHQIPWVGGESHMDELLTWAGERHAEGARLTGEVASYFLPYLEYLRERAPDARFVCLQRDREATVRSFMLKTQRKTNHWRRTRWWHRRSRWNQCFPTFGDELTKEEAIRRYWDEYYRHVGRLSEKMPDALRVWPTTALNEAGGQREILDFVGVPDDRRVIEPGIRFNTKVRITG